MSLSGATVQRRTGGAKATAASGASAGAPAGASVSAPAAVSAGRKVAIVLFLLSLMLPLHTKLGPLRMTPFTFYLLFAFFPLLVLWAGRRVVPFVLPDILFLLFTLWAATAVFVHHGFGPGIEPAGIHLLQTFGAYLLGRVLIRDAESMRFLVKVAVTAMIVLLPFALIESTTGQHPILKAASAIGSALSPVNAGERMGLTRVQGPFEHPILFGVFSASLLSLAFYVLSTKGDRILRWIGTPAVALGVFLSLSTGALLAMNVQLGLMLWGRVLRKVKSRWKIFAAVVTALYVIADLASNRTPFHLFVSYATFSSQSSYNRILIWQFGSAEVWRHPLFGIGFNEWVRPSYMSNSMDNFWLVQAVRYGLPGFLLLASAVLVILFRAGGQKMPSPEMEASRRGFIYALAATMVAITSTHLWNATYVWLIFLFGSAVWLTLPMQGPEPKPVEPAPAADAIPKRRSVVRAGPRRRPSFG